MLKNALTRSSPTCRSTARAGPLGRRGLSVLAAPIIHSRWPRPPETRQSRGPETRPGPLRRALPPYRRRYPVAVAKNRDVLTAAELDELSPSERAQAVRERVVEDLGQIPEGFRNRVEATARRLSTDLNQSVSE